MPKQHENDPAMNPAVLQAQMYELTTTVGGLKNAVETLTEQWGRQDKNANQGRARLHEKIDSVRDTVTGLTHRVTTLEQGVKIIEPSIKIFNEEKLRDEGARRMGKLLWSGILIAAGGMGWAIHELATLLFHK